MSSKLVSVMILLMLTVGLMGCTSDAGNGNVDEESGGIPVQANEELSAMETLNAPGIVLSPTVAEEN